jgi:uncharacterized protein YaiL (DUF2058 family)
MSDSLKDQLLALGLAPAKPARKPKRPAASGKSKKQPPGHKTQQQENGSADISLDQAYKMRIREERRQREETIAQKREQERQRREVNRKIKAMVKQHGIRDSEADCKRNFIFKGRIRSVLATREQIADINTGKLGVVYVSGNYHLMSAAHIEEIRQFAPENIPDLKGADIEGEEDHPVPDDLIW